jgi:hypothetical protein
MNARELCWCVEHTDVCLPCIFLPAGACSAELSLPHNFKSAASIV